MSAQEEQPLVKTTITARHARLSDALREHVEDKVQRLRYGYPRIVEAKVVLDVNNGQNKQQSIAEIILFCANQITIEATSEAENLFAAIDESASKVARQMRKQKTKMLKSHRPDNPPRD